MGRDLTQTMDRVNEDYWYNQWHNDFELHFKLGIKDVLKINNDKPCSIYADTDSCQFDTLIQTESEKITIEEWYNSKNESGGNTIKGHESVLTNDKILNYSKDRGIYYVSVKRIIRHKVSKSKWRLKTKSGKEIIVTNDHSMIVFRNGDQLEVKPSEILKTDKILTILQKQSF